MHDKNLFNLINKMNEISIECINEKCLHIKEGLYQWLVVKLIMHHNIKLFKLFLYHVNGAYDANRFDYRKCRIELPSSFETQ